MWFREINSKISRQQGNLRNSGGVEIKEITNSSSILITSIFAITNKIIYSSINIVACS